MHKHIQSILLLKKRKNQTITLNFALQLQVFLFALNHAGEDWLTVRLVLVNLLHRTDWAAEGARKVLKLYSKTDPSKRFNEYEIY